MFCCVHLLTRCAGSMKKGLCRPLTVRFIQVHLHRYNIHTAATLSLRVRSRYIRRVKTPQLSSSSPHYVSISIANTQNTHEEIVQRSSA